MALTDRAVGRETLRRLSFLFQDGMVLSATLRGLDAVGLLEASLEQEDTVAQLHPGLTRPAFGQLRVGLRTLAQAGWTADGPALAPEHTTIRDYCLLDAMDGGEIVLGERVQFGAQVALHALERVQMGDDSAAGERVSIFDSDHRHDGSHTTNYEQPVAIAPVIIGTNTFLGANSLLLRGVRMGPNGMLGGSSLVRGGEYPGGFLYAGSPAREIRPLAADLGARPAERR